GRLPSTWTSGEYQRRGFLASQPVNLSRFCIGLRSGCGRGVPSPDATRLFEIPKTKLTPDAPACLDFVADARLEGIPSDFEFLSLQSAFGTALSGKLTFGDRAYRRIGSRATNDRGRRFDGAISTATVSEPFKRVSSTPK